MAHSPRSAQPFWGRIQESVGGLHPGYFALVMATGILSTATLELGLPWISVPLLYLTAASYVVLCVLIGWRLVAFPGRVLADATGPERAFAFFTFVAGSDVLGLRLAAAGQLPLAEALALLAAAAWLLLTYAVPAALIAAPHKVPVSAAVNGTWLLWVVGTQAVAGAAATFARSFPVQGADLAFVAVALWGFGALLYVLLMAIILPRLVLGELSPDQLAPPYWITMGATAISVFTASRILALPVRLPIPASTLSGLAFALWAFGTWWFPLLVILGVWRHVLRRVRLTYEPTLWSIVFPLGMYAAASEAFGQVAGLGILELIARVEVWFGLVAWAATFVAMLVSLRATLRFS
ncbi:MAG: tellurite resistance/C4-dicarboxylate transporter family protein [Candidatus Dormibacteraeota bacterium]|nr:tellurite resistance/C4-dicarboxylate transporter family protein [Candidatus Dormibacteraeota bacterium]MBO0760042.1 tellurite resistance/C4-dicarboxylate transporter family protein [Candidatus Dormibacteraeota bacterium]